MCGVIRSINLLHSDAFCQTWFFSSHGVSRLYTNPFEFSSRKTMKSTHKTSGVYTPANNDSCLDRLETVIW